MIGARPRQAENAQFSRVTSCDHATAFHDHTAKPAIFSCDPCDVTRDRSRVIVCDLPYRGSHDAITRSHGGRRSHEGTYQPGRVTRGTVKGHRSILPTVPTPSPTRPWPNVGRAVSGPAVTPQRSVGRRCA